MVPSTMLSTGTGQVLKDSDPRRATYLEMVRSLQFLDMHTRPDFTFSIGMLSGLMSKPY
jgi:hypothetical protein